LRRQEKVAKEKAIPRTRPPHIHVLRVRERPPGFAEGTSVCLRRTGPHPAGHPSDFSVVRSPYSKGPIGAHPARTRRQSKQLRLGPSEARMAAVEAELFRGPCAAVRAGREGPQGGRNGLRPLAAAPRMARRLARPVRTDFSSMEGRKTQHRGGLSLGDFSLAKQREVTRAPGRRAEKDRDVEGNWPLAVRAERNRS
jgi:hypothetical protein